MIQASTTADYTLQMYNNFNDNTINTHVTKLNRLLIMTHIKTFLRQLISQSCLLISDHLLNVTNIRHHEFRVVSAVLVCNTANLDNNLHNIRLWHRTSTNNSQQVPVIGGGMLSASVFASVHGMAYMHPFSRFISLITISSPLLARRRRLRATLSHTCAHSR